ncbi:MAG: hypothetical protein AAGH67_08605 [Cyanobacteria bacterium P01_H01_bin.162]
MNHLNPLVRLISARKRFVMLVVLSFGASLLPASSAPAQNSRIVASIERMIVFNRYDVRGNMFDEPYLMYGYANGSVERCIEFPLPSGRIEVAEGDDITFDTPITIPFRENGIIYVQLWDRDGSSKPDCFENGNDNQIGDWTIDLRETFIGSHRRDITSDRGDGAHYALFFDIYDQIETRR